MLGDLSRFQLEDKDIASGAFLFNMTAQPVLVRKVIEAQLGDDEVQFLLDDVLNDTGLEGWKVCVDEDLRFQDCLFMPECCKEEVLKVFHNANFAFHPGGTKMY